MLHFTLPLHLYYKVERVPKYYSEVYMLRISHFSVLVATVAILTIITTWGTQPILAQGPQPGRRSINAQAFNACTTTNYADIAAKALNITAAELRKDIVSGTTMQDIATGA